MKNKNIFSEQELLAHTDELASADLAIEDEDVLEEPSVSLFDQDELEDKQDIQLIKERKNSLEIKVNIDDL